LIYKYVLDDAVLEESAAPVSDVQRVDESAIKPHIAYTSVSIDGRSKSHLADIHL